MNGSLLEPEFAVNGVKNVCQGELDFGLARIELHSGVLSRQFGGA
jgi:hypothetical protein